jgi:protease secretion system membrane fusion protein
MRKPIININFKDYQTQGWCIVFFGFFGFLLWSLVYPIDQGIPGAGYLIPKAEKIQISSPISGLVTSVHKAAGDRVAINDVLVEFDALTMESNLRRFQESQAGLKQSISAMELALKAKHEQILVLKYQLKESKRVYDAGFNNQTRALISKNEHVRLLGSQLEQNKKLFDSGFLSLSALEKSKSELAWAEGEAFDLGAKNEQVVTAASQNLSMIKTQIAMAESESLELNSRLEDVKARLREITEQIKATEHEVALLRVMSPVNGTVMNSLIKSAGVNLSQGQQILEIVPDSKVLTFEVRIPVEYADRVYEGMAADVMFPSLPGSSTKIVKGKLTYISGDKMVDKQTNQTYLEARVDPVDNETLDKMNLRVGLPATVMINTGPRTLMSYILRPFVDRLSMGLQ